MNCGLACHRHAAPHDTHCRVTKLRVQTFGRPIRCRGNWRIQSMDGVTERQTPQWAGDTLLSAFVNLLIKTPLLYAIMKTMARQVMQSTAEKRGVPWTASVKKLQSQQQQLEEVKRLVEDASLQLPDYFLQPFHAYTRGNMEWLAAYEVEAATYAMAWRAYKEEELTPQQAHDRLRGSITNAMQVFLESHGGREVCDVLDMGCGVGMSSRDIALRWPEANVSALDLSPYFLAVAEQHQRVNGPPPGSAGLIRHVHGPMEDTPFPNNSFDVISCQFVVHECPQRVTRQTMREAARLLRPGGVVTFVDSDPKSKVIQNLPPFLFTLMKSTEPFHDEYYTLKMTDELHAAGFRHVEAVAVDPRHTAFMGMK